MATVTAAVRKTFYYDPDGTHSPLTIEFPESTNLIEGESIELVNTNKSSSNSVTLQANADSATDEIEDPDDGTAAYASSVAVAASAGYRMEFKYVETPYAVGTWLCTKLKTP